MIETSTDHLTHLHNCAFDSNLIVTKMEPLLLLPRVTTSPNRLAGGFEDTWVEAVISAVRY